MKGWTKPPRPRVTSRPRVKKTIRVPLILCLPSFLLEDDTKLNPYAGEDGEYRAACPSSSDLLPFGPTPKEGAAVTLPLCFCSWCGWGEKQQPELRREVCWVGRQGTSGQRPPMCLHLDISLLSQEPLVLLLQASLLLNIHRPKRSERRREGLQGQAGRCGGLWPSAPCPHGPHSQ